MKVQPAAFLRTTLPLDLSTLPMLDGGRYHSIWLPDHLVSFWPDSIWTPEFTDLATASPSPHRHLDALVVAGAVAVQTKNVPIATSVMDTVRRHPAMLAQSATLAEMANIGICLDVFSCWTEAGLKQTIERAIPRTSLVQVGDYLFGDAVSPGRTVPGDGNIPLARILDWILRAGYRGAFEVEVIGPRIDQEGHLQATHRAAKNLTETLRLLGA